MPKPGGISPEKLLYSKFRWSNSPSSLMALRSMRFLEFSFNRLNGAIPETITNLTHLESSCMGKNSLTRELFLGPSARDLCRGRFLYDLDISSNNFNGSLQPLHSCSSLIFGHIPGEIGGAK